jgi:hypothetical protein
LQAILHLRDLGCADPAAAVCGADSEGVLAAAIEPALPIPDAPITPINAMIL